MSDYTPTTEQVREAYLLDSLNPSRDRKEFQRWLAEHDRQVKAQAWDECSQSLFYEDGEPVAILKNNNPYKEQP